MDPTPYIIGGIAGLVAGGGVAYAILNGVLKGKASTIIKEAEQKGENIKEKKILQARRNSSSSRKSTARKSRRAMPRCKPSKSS